MLKKPAKPSKPVKAAKRPISKKGYPPSRNAGRTRETKASSPREGIEGVAPDLRFDPENPNQGTEQGKKMLARSLSRLGAGRSILISKDGVILAGNKTYAAAKRAKIPIRVVKSDGKELVVVQRTDLQYADPKARELTVADNRASEQGLEWNPDVLATLAQDGGLDPYFTPFELDVIVGDGVFEVANASEGEQAVVGALAEALTQRDKMLESEVTKWAGKKEDKTPADVARRDAMKARRKESQESRRDDNDSEFVVVLVFNNREEQTEFLTTYGFDEEDKFVDGNQLVENIEAMQ